MYFLHDIIKNGDMMKKIIYMCIITLLLSACTTNTNNLKKYDFTSTNLGFDTVIMFSAYTKNEEEFNKYKTILINEFKRYDQLFDKYHSYSNLANMKTINDAAGDHAVKVDEEIVNILSMAREFDTLSNHQFSVTLGSVLNIWHDAREYAAEHKEDAYLPSKEELTKANENTGWDYVDIDKDKNEVFIKNKGTQLDVGAIAKGYAVEAVAQKLESAGLEHGLINGGGNVRLIGSKPNNEPWSVGLQIPNVETMETKSLISISIDSSSSFVTSGDYQRYYKYDGKRMHHIIDPSTLYPANHARSVTIITKDSGLADMLSTTLFTMSYKDGKALLNSLQEQNIHVEAIWVYDDEVKPETKDTIKKDGYYLAFTDGVKDMIK